MVFLGWVIGAGVAGHVIKKSGKMPEKPLKKELNKNADGIPHVDLLMASQNMNLNRWLKRLGKTSEGFLKYLWTDR